MVEFSEISRRFGIGEQLGQDGNPVGSWKGILPIAISQSHTLFVMSEAVALEVGITTKRENPVLPTLAKVWFKQTTTTKKMK